MDQIVYPVSTRLAGITDVGLDLLTYVIHVIFLGDVG